VDDRTDDELLAALERGQTEALGVLYDRHAPVLFTLAVHLAGSRARGEDIVHDIFLDLARAARRRDPQLRHALRWLVLRVFQYCET
jgi:RNA polymerase sigma-70 factor (ECF subfamily)